MVIFCGTYIALGADYNYFFSFTFPVRIYLKATFTHARIHTHDGQVRLNVSQPGCYYYNSLTQFIMQL